VFFDISADLKITRHVMVRMVINRSPSAFLLSEQAILMLRSRKKNLVELHSSIPREQRLLMIGSLSVRRDDLDLVAIVEKLGRDANGRDTELEIVSIPDCHDWSIGDVCGIEFVLAHGSAWPKCTQHQSTN